MTALQIVAIDGQLEDEELRSQLHSYTRELMLNNLSPNTRRVYRTAMDHFTRWAETTNRHLTMPLDSAVVLHYIDFCIAAGLKVSTVQQYVKALRVAHRLCDLDFPTHADPRRDPIKLKLGEIARDHGTAPKKAKAITQRLLVQMVTSRPATTTGHRDTTVLLVGFTGAFRRSELAGLNVDDVLFEDDGMVIRLRQSKTGAADVYVSYGRHPSTCPVRQTRAWIDRLDRSSGPLLVGMRRGDHLGTRRLTGPTIDAVVKRCAQEVGETATYSAHSLRSGLATSAARAKARNDVIMRQTRHASLQSLQGYIQAGTGFTENVMQYLSLL